MTSSIVIANQKKVDSGEEMATKKSKKRKNKGWRNAANSDRHELYELSVQDAESECEIIDQVWSECRQRKATSIREDFCGTALTASAWVKLRKDNEAVCVDNDQTVLDWAADRVKERLADNERSRISFVNSDVNTVNTKPVESVLAMNFSYYLFKTRKDLLAYFRSVHKSLTDDGLFLLDAYGGSDSFLEMEEDRDLDGFTYIWDQHSYSPVTGDAINHIHFSFPDGSRMEKAFTYEWRLWTLPEIQEVLKEAGFSKVVVYWEGSDEDSEEGNGEWEVTRCGEACEGWIAYLVAEK